MDGNMWWGHVVGLGACGRVLGVCGQGVGACPNTLVAGCGGTPGRVWGHVAGVDVCA